MANDAKTLTIHKVVFEIREADRGFTAKAFYLEEPNKGDALVEIYRDGEPYRRFLFPAYKIWNIAAHFSDIVTGQLEDSMSGFDMAGWAGFHVVPIREARDAD